MQPYGGIIIGNKYHTSTTRVELDIGKSDTDIIGTKVSEMFWWRYIRIWLI